MLDIVLAFFWYPDGPASPLEMESDSAIVESRVLFRVGGTEAVVGMEGLRTNQRSAFMSRDLCIDQSQASFHVM